MLINDDDADDDEDDDDDDDDDDDGDDDGGHADDDEDDVKSFEFWRCYDAWARRCNCHACFSKLPNVSSKAFALCEGTGHQMSK